MLLLRLVGCLYYCILIQSLRSNIPHLGGYSIWNPKRHYAILRKPTQYGLETANQTV